MEAVAKYDFKATADDELSFKRGEILKVNYFFFSSSLNDVVYVWPQSFHFGVFHLSLHVSMYVECKTWYIIFKFEIKALDFKTV